MIVPPRMITLPPGARPCSWQGRCWEDFGTEDAHADLIAQAGHHGEPLVQARWRTKVRAAIRASNASAPIPAERDGVTEQTVCTWRRRDSVDDRGHTPRRLQTTLTPAQGSKVKRSIAAKNEPGHVHIDVTYLPRMAGESSRRHLFVAIDRAAPRVFIRVFKAKTAANARRFLRGLERACPMRIRTVLTDNGRKFTDRLFGPRNRAATGEREGDTLCTALGTEHRLILPKSPQSKPSSAIGQRTMASAMVGRFNGRIEGVLQSRHFRSGR